MKSNKARSPCLSCDIHISGITKKRNKTCINCLERIKYDVQSSGETGFLSANPSIRERYTVNLNVNSNKQWKRKNLY